MNPRRQALKVIAASFAVLAGAKAHAAADITVYFSPD